MVKGIFSLSSSSGDGTSKLNEVLRYDHMVTFEFTSTDQYY